MALKNKPACISACNSCSSSSMGSSLMFRIVPRGSLAKFIPRSSVDEEALAVPPRSRDMSQRAQDKNYTKDFNPTHGRGKCASCCEEFRCSGQLSKCAHRETLDTKLSIDCLSLCAPFSHLLFQVLYGPSKYSIDFIFHILYLYSRGTCV